MVDIVASVWQSSTCLDLGPDHCQHCPTPQTMPGHASSRSTRNYDQIAQENECLRCECNDAIRAINELRRKNKRLKKALINGESSYYA